MRLPPSDLTLLRDSKAHYTDLYLSIFQPNIVLKARVDQVGIQKGEQEIPYDTVTQGSWQNVKIGATLLVGSSVGARDVGKVRIKSITSSVITIAENEHIEWANNLYLTVLDYFDVWPVFPRMIQDPADDEKVIWYKDYDILYTNQNKVLGCFMKMGPHRAGFVENGTAQFYFTASGTGALSGAIDAYYWTFQSGTPSSYTGRNPGYVDFPTGHYLVTLGISGTNGWGEEGHRYVSVYDKPSEGTNIPVLKWDISDLQGSRPEGGYTASITVYEEVEVQEGSIIVIFADEWYDNTHKSLGGNTLNNSAIKFVGYVMDNSIRYDYKASAVTFDVASITDVMKNLEGFSVSVESKVTPDDWYELWNMNAKKAVYHYLKWHSNVISLADIDVSGIEDCPVQFFDSDRESMFDAVDNFLRTAYHASMVADRQGKLWLETDAWVVPNATGTFSPIFVLSKYDWIGEPDITERRYPELSYLEYNGIAYSDASTGTFKPLMSEAPGSAPAYRGKSERHTGLALESQAQLNRLTGNEFFHRNFQFPSVSLSMRGNWSNLDIAPQEVAQFNISADDTVRGVAVNGLYQPTNVVWQIDHRNKTFMPRVTWGVVTTGPGGETIPIPEIPEDGGYGPKPGGPGPIIPPSIPISTGTAAGAFIQTVFNVTLSITAPYPSFYSVPIGVVDQTPGFFTFASGTYSGTSGTQSIYIPVTGHYRISLMGHTAYPGSGNFDDTILTVIVNGTIPSVIEMPRLGNNINDGTPEFALFADTGAFTIIKSLTAGQQLGVGVTCPDSVTAPPETAYGWLLVEYVGT